MRASVVHQACVWTPDYLAQRRASSNTAYLSDLDAVTARHHQQMQLFDEVQKLLDEPEPLVPGDIVAWHSRPESLYVVLNPISYSVSPLSICSVLVTNGGCRLIASRELLVKVGSLTSFNLDLGGCNQEKRAEKVPTSGGSVVDGNGGGCAGGAIIGALGSSPDYSRIR